MFFKKISFRIGAWYTLALLVSTVALFGITAYFLATSLRNKDRDLLTGKIQEYTTIYRRDGIGGLKLQTSTHEVKDAEKFVLRVSDRNGKTLFIHSPDRSGDTDALTVADIDHFLLKFTGQNAWITIPGKDYGDDVEVLSRVLDSGDTVQVGKDTEDREDVLESFASAFLTGLIPIFILAAAIGIFLSGRILKPIRWLTQTVESIRQGNPKARVSLRGNKDELDHLGSLFNQMLEQNEKLIQGMRDTVDNVAHDLRTPIMRLRNSIEGALSGKEEVVRFREALFECQESSEIILKMLDGIMEISEAEAGTLSIKSESVDLCEIARSVVDLYAFVAEDKEINLIVEGNNPVLIRGDQTRLLQAIANLIDNAIKYSPPKTNVVVQVTSENEIAALTVGDEGPGIPDEEISKIWGRLYRGDKSRNTRGLGLGLSLVKAIVEAHNGQITVLSSLSGGSAFTVRVPKNTTRED